MKNNKREKRIAATIAAALLLILAGGYQIYMAFSNAYEILSAEHNEHLLDLAWSMDRNTASFLADVREGLEMSVAMNGTVQELPQKSGDAWREYLRNLVLARSSHVSVLLAIAPDGEIYDNCGEECPDYQFPNGWGTEIPCLCIDSNGENYLAIVTPAPQGEMHYAALIDLREFYHQVAGNELTGGYWLTLFDEATGVLLQNDQSQSEVIRISVDDALARQDGISILVGCEKDGQVNTQPYSYTDPDGVTTANLMAVIPSNHSHNSVFAVGVAMNSEHLAAMLRGILARIVAFAALVLVGIAALLSVLLQRRRTNDEMREQVALMEKQNKTIQEMAHHQRLEMIGTMTSSIAHEFNNLLTPIMGYSIMTMESLPEDYDELIENLSEIYDASRRAKTLVSRLSALSRKNVADSNRYFSPDTLVDKVLDMARTSLPPRVAVECELHCPEKCLLADETQIGQLLLNLVINAFQAMENEGGTMTIATAQEGKDIVFTVKDTGPGIRPEYLPQLFDPFFTTKEMGRGTGLGLAIVQRIAQEHGGMVTVKSEVGHGASFTVTLPADQQT
ncbi:MAG: HAMP domain-containing histidine kinase [Clostridiales bacterium]|nr:HAMP domain-containing histidine kinase [Candidatus Cacconaster stercorequi]